MFKVRVNMGVDSNENTLTPRIADPTACKTASAPNNVPAPASASVLSPEPKFLICRIQSAKLCVDGCTPLPKQLNDETSTNSISLMRFDCFFPPKKSATCAVYSGVGIRAIKTTDIISTRNENLARLRSNEISFARCGLVIGTPFFPFLGAFVVAGITGLILGGIRSTMSPCESVEATLGALLPFVTGLKIEIIAIIRSQRNSQTSSRNN